MDKRTYMVTISCETGDMDDAVARAASWMFEELQGPLEISVVAEDAAQIASLSYEPPSGRDWQVSADSGRLDPLTEQVEMVREAVEQWAALDGADSVDAHLNAAEELASLAAALVAKIAAGQGAAGQGEVK
jgi:hypothetical protein